LPAVIIVGGAYFNIPHSGKFGFSSLYSISFLVIFTEQTKWKEEADIFPSPIHYPTSFPKFVLLVQQKSGKQTIPAKR
jgi:hypothetical protein